MILTVPGRKLAALSHVSAVTLPAVQRPMGSKAYSPLKSPGTQPRARLVKTGFGDAMPHPSLNEPHQNYLPWRA